MDNLTDTQNKLVEKAQELANLAYRYSQSEVLDPEILDKLQLEISALLASIGSNFVKAQYQADMWKQWGKDLTEVLRSLRRMNETLNTEKRFTR